MARREERLHELCSSLSSAPGEIVPLTGDIATAACQQAAIDLAAEKFGGLDLVINNAGIGAMGRFAEASPARLRQVMEVNFFAPVELIRLALPALHKSSKPMVVNVGSVLGHRGVPNCSEYCASKFALEGFSQSLRAELAREGIDVLAVSPSRTRTEFFDQAMDTSGTPWPKLQGMTSEAVAQRIVRGIRRGQRQLIISLGGKSLVWASRLFPGIVDRVIARFY